MKKSLLIWGALIVVALCFVGCCYYNTTHCANHCKHDPCCYENNQKCDSSNQNDADDDEVDTVTVEAVEIVPLNNSATPSNSAPDAGKSTPKGK